MGVDDGPDHEHHVHERQPGRDTRCERRYCGVLWNLNVNIGATSGERLQFFVEQQEVGGG